MPVCSGIGDLSTARPLPDSDPAIPVSPRISAPLRGFASPSPDHCVQSDLLSGSSPSETARSPVAPRLGTVSQCRSRIMAPGPLLPRRLAVPQTSWNHFNFPPDRMIKSIRFHTPVAHKFRKWKLSPLRISLVWTPKRMIRPRPSTCTRIYGLCGGG